MRLPILTVFLFTLSLASPVRAGGFDAFIQAAPAANPAVIRLAMEAEACALTRGIKKPSRLAVIDYSRPSTEVRLWVFDLQRMTLLQAEHVAHGRGSGGNFPDTFSNINDSFQTSLGLFTTAENYIGQNGHSLRMDGLEPGFNDLARDRAIVIHGADYVDPMAARIRGRLGRSLGCPAVRRKAADKLINHLKDGQMLFAYYPDTEWLANSKMLGCADPDPDSASAALDVALKPDIDSVRSSRPRFWQRFGVWIRHTFRI